MTYVDLTRDEYREVQVQHRDGVWYPGQLKAYRKVENVLEGYVRYSIGFAETRLAWFEAGRVAGTRVQNVDDMASALTAAPDPDAVTIYA